MFVWEFKVTEIVVFPKTGTGYPHTKTSTLPKWVPIESSGSRKERTLKCRNPWSSGHVDPSSLFLSHLLGVGEELLELVLLCVQ